MEETHAVAHNAIVYMAGKNKSVIKGIHLARDPGIIELLEKPARGWWKGQVPPFL